jgi:hypothetical protein
MRSPFEISRDDRIRRNRLADLRKLYQARYGHEFPDDDAGREDLFEFLLPISNSLIEPAKRMRQAIELWAPWMAETEIESTVAHVSRMPIWERKPGARLLGQRLRLTNAEREQLKIKTIKPVDMTDDELDEQRRAKARARERRRRQERGAKPRAQSLSRIKPWLAEGLSRRTWYRRKEKPNGLERSREDSAPGTTGMPA